MFRFFLLILLLSVGPISVTAQAVPEQQPPAKAEVFIGYSYLIRDYRHTQLNPVRGGMNGWSAGCGLPSLFGKHLGLVADLAGNYSAGGFFTPQLHFAALGPQYSMSVGRSTVFIHVGGGVILASGDVIAQTSSTTVFFTEIGGGIDRPIRQRLDWRLNGDWLHGGFQTNDTNQISEIVKNNFRISTGPVLHF